jgi:hypothetical protein
VASKGVQSAILWGSAVLQHYLKLKEASVASVGKFLGGVVVTLGVLGVALAYKVGMFDKLEEFIDDVAEEAKARFVEENCEAVEGVADDL